MPCPCFPDCGCALEAGDLILIEGSGNLLDPWIVSGIETVFSATGTNGIAVTPGGDYGHEPTIEILVDPAGTAPVSVGPDGLKVDCCDVAIASILDVSDTSTIDLTLAGDTLSADVNVSADACNAITVEPDGLFASPGERTVDLAGSSSTVNISTIAGNDSGASWRYCITNPSSTCGVFVTIYGQAIVNAEIVSSAANVDMDLACRLELEAGTGVTVTQFAGATSTKSVRANEMTNTGSLNPFGAGEGITFQGQLFGRIYLPPSGRAQVKSYVHTTNFDNLDGDVASGLGYIFDNVYLVLTREDPTIGLTFTSGACT